MTPRCTDCGGPLNRGGQKRSHARRCIICQVAVDMRDFHYPASQRTQALRRERKNADARRLEPLPEQLESDQPAHS